MSNNINTKKCKTCLLEKSIYDFQVQNNRCIKCKNAIHRNPAYYKLYYEKHKEDMHQKYLDNSEVIKEKYKNRYHELCEKENRPKKGRGRPKKEIVPPVELIEISNDILV